jgi:hypothetical protein
MTRHQRRKAARARKDAKAELLNSRALHVLQTEKLKRNLTERKATSERVIREIVFLSKDLKRVTRVERKVVATKPTAPRGLGNRGIYQAIGMYPAPGYGTGAFKEKPMSERTLREHRANNT